MKINSTRKHKYCKISRPLKTYFHCICSSSPWKILWSGKKNDLYDFIWDNKIARIKRNTIIGECENGRLNMTDFSLMNKALKCIWIKRFRLNEATSHLGGFSFLSKCYCSSKDISIKELPLFYKRTLQYWFEFKDTQDNTKWGIKNMIIWNNKDFKLIIILSSFKLGLVE